MAQSLSVKNIESRHPPIQGPYTSVGQLTGLRHAAREIDLLALHRVINPLSGLLASNIRGRGIDFAEVRVYQPGDDIRTIDWRVTARTQKPHTKLFEEEKERPVLLVVDQTDAMFFGSRVTFKSVIAAQAAALLAWTALDRGDRVGGLVFACHDHCEIRPKRTKQSVLRLIHEIDTFNRALGKSTPAPRSPEATGQEEQSEKYKRDIPGDHLASAVRRIRRIAHHGATIFLISDFSEFSPETRIHLAHLARHNDVVGIHIADHLEKELPPPDQYTITNGREKTLINTSNDSHRERYRSHYEEKLDAIRQEFVRLRAPFFQLTTDQSVVNALANQYTRYIQTSRRPASMRTR